jgi:periplasmic protein CpxP/Spy
MDTNVDYDKRYRFALVVIAVLVLLNIITIAFILTSPIGRDLFKGRERIQSTLEDELQLTDAQKRQYALLRARHFARGDSMAAIEFRTMDSLMAMMRAPVVKDEEVRRLTLRLGELATDRNDGLFSHFRAVRAICTPEQQIRFDTVIVKVMQMILDPRRPPNPNAPPPGGPQHPNP